MIFKSYNQSETDKDETKMKVEFVQSKNYTPNSIIC